MDNPTSNTSWSIPNSKNEKEYHNFSEKMAKKITLRQDPYDVDEAIKSLKNSEYANKI